MRKAMVVAAVAFALGGSALSTNAYALASAYGGGHSASGGDASHVGNSHRRLRNSHRRGYERDPWGYWGAYYGPMITVP